MSTYDITLTDPLKSGFTIQPGAFDGPGGSRANTTLRLYGRGALEWGEAVDEDLVRLGETFAGATPPLYPLPGQLWMRIRYYWHDTSATPTTGWWFYNPSTKAWARLNGNGTIPDSSSNNPTIGSYYIDTGTSTLYRWDTAYKQAGAAWMVRQYSASNLGNAAPTHQPEQDLLVWDQYGNNGNGRWASPLTVAATNGAPAEAQQGALWYDLVTGKLKIWTGTKWKEILGPTNGSNTVAAGDINMSLYKIINLADGTIAAGNKEAVNGGTVYNYVNNSITGLGSVYLPLAGGTITGNLTVNGTTNLGGNVNLTNGLTVGGATTMHAVTVTSLTASSTVSMGGQRVQNVGTPTAGTDAVTKSYTDSAISNLSSSLGGISASNVSMVYGGSGAYKTGDICVNGTNIYIAINSGTTPPPSANWKLIYPASFL